MCQQTQIDFYKKFLVEDSPIKSHLTTHMLHDYFLVEVSVQTIENKQDAMVCFGIYVKTLVSSYFKNILTWTFFYRRMTRF
jgi:pre-mRNA-splicing helicase BRR2